MEIPPAEVERVWVIRNTFLLLDINFAYAFLRSIITEHPISKGNEFFDNFICALGEKAIPFFSNMLRVEIKHATSTSDFMKPTSVTGKLLSSFIHLHTQEYFRKVLASPLSGLIKATSLEGSSSSFSSFSSFSSSPSSSSSSLSSSSPSSVRAGPVELQGVADGFTDLIDAVFNSDSQCPVEVKAVLKILLDTVDAKLKDGLKLVGFFILERGWCNAISLPKTILPDMEVEAKVYLRLQLLAKMLYDLGRQAYDKDKGPFATLLEQSSTTMIEYLANICANQDKGPRTIVGTKTSQQVMASKAFIDLFPLVTRAVLESSLSKYLSGEENKEQCQHIQDMYNIFKTVASDIGLNAMVVAANKSASIKNIKTISKKDLLRREGLSKAIKAGDMKEFNSIATSPEGKVMLDTPMDDGSYPIITASASRQSAIVKYLVQTARVGVNVTDLQQMTAFMWACKTGTEDILSYLLSARPQVDVNTSNLEGYTPLHFLLQTLPQHEALLLSVIDKGANVNAASKVGESILAHAVKYRCSYSVIQTIVANGADIDYKDAAGRTALYWAEALKLLQQKGAAPTALRRVNTIIQIDTCTCSFALSVSHGGTCSACGKPRVREMVPTDKGIPGFTRPWSVDQVRNDINGRSLEQRCAVLGRKTPGFYQITFHFGEKEFTAKAPTNALCKVLLRRVQADTAVSFAWEREVVYGLTFFIPPAVTATGVPSGELTGDQRREVWMDLENPIWLYDFEENIHLYIKPIEKEKKSQFYLKFMFPPLEVSLVLAINPFQMPKSILTSILVPYLPPHLASEATRMGMHLHLETGSSLLNDEQPISTLNIISWDIVSIRLREAYELEFIDDPTRTILIERNFSVAKAIDSLSHFLKLGQVPTKVEDLTAPLSPELQALFLEEGIPLPSNLVSKDVLPPSDRPKLSTTQSQYFETRPKVIRGASGGSKTPNERASTWNVTSPSPGLTKSTDVYDGSEMSLAAPHRPQPNSRTITIPTSPAPASGSASLPNSPDVGVTSPNFATPATPTFVVPSTPILSPANPPPSPQFTTTSPPTSPTLPVATLNPTASTSSLSNNNNNNNNNNGSNSNSNSTSSFTPSFSASTPYSFASAIAGTIVSTTSNIANFARKGSPSSSISNSASNSSTNLATEIFYVKETVRSLAKVVRHTPMLLPENTPLATFSLVAGDILEIGDRVVIYPRDSNFALDKYTLVLPPVLKRLRVKWVSPNQEGAINAPTLSPSNSSSSSGLTNTASSSSLGGITGPRTSADIKSDAHVLSFNPTDICVRNEAKLLFLGHLGSGKTSLVRQLQRIRSVKDEKESLRDASKVAVEDKYMNADLCGVVKFEWKVKAENDSKYMFRIHELVGKEEFSFSQQFLIAPGCIFVLVFSLEQPIDEVIQSWLETIQTRAKDAPVIIVGTNADAKEVAKKVNVILDTMAKRYSTRYPNIAGFTAVSSKNFKGIFTLAQLLLQTAREKGMVDNKLPVSHAILAKLLALSRQEAHRVHCPPYITWEHIKAIGERMGLWEKQLKAAMQYCMDISGIAYFGFDTSSPLADLVFLDNLWLPALMSSVVRFKPANTDAMVLHSQLCQIWKSPYFPSHIHPILIDLLNRFEVLFAQDEFHYLVPLLLPEEKPAAVKDLIPPFEPAGGTQSERIFEFGPVPVGFFSRLVARLLGVFDSMIYWRNGIVVTPQQQDGNANCRAILEYIPATYRLRMSVRNDKGGKLLRPLAEGIMTYITAWFPGRLRHVYVTCAHCIANQSYDPFYFDLNECEKAASMGKQYVMCRGVHPVRIDLLALDVTLNDQSTIRYDQITLQEKLGEGSFAKVYKGVCGGKVVAVKVINMQEDESTEIFREFRKEALLMSGLQHPNIVSLRGICLKPLCLVAELLPLGDLHSFLLDTTKPMNWPLRVKIARDIAMGMEFLHCSTPPVVHRDLKSPNILLGWTKDKQVVAKVTDFGLSTRSNAKMVGRQVWNVSWLAPEIMRGNAYSTKVDVYSYGVVLWELLVRQKPFAEFDTLYKFDRQLEDGIEKGLRPTIPQDCLPEYADLVRACWADVPASRPSFTEIIDFLNHFEQSRVHAGGETTMPTIDVPIPTDIPYDDPSPSSPTPIDSSQNSNLNIAASIILVDDFGEDDSKESEEKEKEDKVAKMLTYKCNGPNAPGTTLCMLTVTIKGAYQVWVGCSDGSIAVIDAKSRKQLHQVKHHTNRVCHMICIYRVKQEPIVWTASMDGTIVVMDTTNVSKPLKVIKVERPLTCLQEVGDSVWSGSLDGFVRIYDKVKFKLKKTIKNETGMAIGCFLAPSEDKVWVGTEKNILIMDAKNYTFLQELEGHTSMINSIRYVHNTVWSCSAEGEVLKVLQGHSGRVFCLLAVGAFVISGSWDKSMFVWDAKTQSFLYEVAGHHTDGIGSIVLAKDEIWSGSWDKSISIFTLEDNL